MECVVAQRQIARTIVVLASLGLLSTPACATQMLSAKDATDLSQYESGISDQGAAKGTATGIVNRIAAAVPEPAAWLMMLAGFGLLGSVSRRGTPHPLDDTQAL